MVSNVIDARMRFVMQKIEPFSFPRLRVAFRDCEGSPYYADPYDEELQSKPRALAVTPLTLAIADFIRELISLNATELLDELAERGVLRRRRSADLRVYYEQPVALYNPRSRKERKRAEQELVDFRAAAVEVVTGRPIDEILAEMYWSRT